MRRILTATSLVIAAAGLAGCGGGDDSFRAEYRTRAVEACASGGRSSPKAAAVQSAGIDFQRVCECAVDRHLANSTTAALRDELRGKSGPAGAQAAMMQCVTETLQAGRAKAGG